MMWVPPESPHNLIQRQFYDDPWRLLVACVFCNLTRRIQAEPIMWEFFKKWPTPQAARSADEEVVAQLLAPLGLSRRRAKTLKRMSADFLDLDWKDPIELYGIGKYASDAYRIFCVGEWESVSPKDHALVWYHDWLKEHKGGKDGKR